jgi:TRAP-type mannitol/chloroaromatic compound transport system permease small subunit
LAKGANILDGGALHGRALSLRRREISVEIDLKSSLACLNALLDRLTLAGSALVLPLSLLLFAQWPLRDLVGFGSRPANDIAQWIFALYVALALRHTTRVRGHMAAEMVSARYPGWLQESILRWGQALCVLPWAAFVLVSSTPTVWHSLRGLESFPDTGNPLYFMIKISGWLMALLMTVQALLDLLPTSRAAQR